MTKSGARVYIRYRYVKSQANPEACITIVIWHRRKHFSQEECTFHENAIKWKHFPRNWPFVRGFPSQRPVTRSFDMFFALRLNKRLRKQSRRRWFETPSCSLWRHCNVDESWSPLSERPTISSYRNTRPRLNYHFGHNKKSGEAMPFRWLGICALLWLMYGSHAVVSISPGREMDDLPVIYGATRDSSRNTYLKRLFSFNCLRSPNIWKDFALLWCLFPFSKTDIKICVPS